MTASMEAGITNPNSKEYLEEDVRRVFQNGEAAFALNWTYMFNLANAGDEARSRDRSASHRHRAWRGSARFRP